MAARLTGSGQYSLNFGVPMAEGQTMKNPLRAQRGQWRHRIAGSTNPNNTSAIATQTMARRL
jgi:hypothetical protein